MGRSRIAMVTLAQLVIDAIDSQGVLKQDLADALQISPASITKWIREKRRESIPWRHWRGICKFLHIPWSTWIAVAKREVPHSVILFDRYVRLSGK